MRFFDGKISCQGLEKKLSAYATPATTPLLTPRKIYSRAKFAHISKQFYFHGFGKYSNLSVHLYISA